MTRRRSLIPLVALIHAGAGAGIAQTPPPQTPSPRPEGPRSREDFDAEQAQALLKLLNTPVQVASNLVTDRNKQPVSITTLTRDQIQLSGARRLSDVLTLYVPGFFAVEDQDDTIAAFRGIAPDNNSKVLFMVNGHVLNTEWFLGPPDALLNGIALDSIERVDIIRGPGSATLGQGALLGIINVVTRIGVMEGHTLSAGGGKDNAYAASYEGGSANGELRTYAHLTVTNYDGQPIRAEGNATRDWEGVQGGKLYEGGDRLRRASGVTALVNLATDQANLELLHADQTRDMYNFRRDRSAYEQCLDSLMGSYTFDLGEGHSLKTSAGLAQDDYILHSNLGFIMGGTREYRQSLSAIYKGVFGSFRLAAGGDYQRYAMGRRNRDGNNFVSNLADASLLNTPNATRAWVYPTTIAVKGFFAEGFLSVTRETDLFGAFRYDQHPFWGNHFTPRFGVLYAPQEVWNFRVSYQTGFRGAPGVHYAGGFQNDGLLRESNFGQVSAATAGQEPNLGKVRPEKMSSLELQSVWSPSHALKADLVLFQSTVGHVIGFGYFDASMVSSLPSTIGTDQKGDWNGYWYFQNTKGSFTSRGAELSIAYHHPLLDVLASHALVRVASVDDSAYDSLYLTPQTVGKHFKSYPEDISRVHLVLFPRSVWNAAFTALRYGRWYGGNQAGEGALIVDAALRVQLSPRLQLQASLTNLTNGTRLYPFTEGPASTVTDPRPGTPSLETRTYWVKASYTF
jgi:outer membrane receptor protein involved in Fe transport